MKKLIIILTFIFSANLVSAQAFEITALEQTSENLIVHYNLMDTTANRTYTVFLYKNGTEPLKKVKGDVGISVKPGVNNRITWSAKEELGADFKGSLELEVRGKVYVPFLEFEGFPEGKKVRRGKSYFYSWEGSSRSKILNFDLYKGDHLEYALPEVANTGGAELIIPTSVKPGRYKFIVTDAKNKDLVVESPEIIIKPKLPLPVKLIPLALAGGGYMLISSNAEDPPLDGPPPVPSNN